jgi:hypothetical protein
MGSGGKSSKAGKLGPASILNQNPIFEIGSMNNLGIRGFRNTPAQFCIRNPGVSAHHNKSKSA